MLEVGPTASPYVATTTAPASNGIGLHWLDPDGVDDRLVLSAVPFSGSDDLFIVAGVTRLTASSGRTLFVTDSASGRHMVLSGSDTTGNRSLNFFDNAYGASGIWTGASTDVGTPELLTGRRDGNAKTLRQNSVPRPVNNTVQATNTNLPTVAILGCQSTTLVTINNFFNGPIYALALGKGTITDAQLALIERHIANLSGVQL
jgi:hypothetical protein